MTTAIFCANGFVDIRRSHKLKQVMSPLSAIGSLSIRTPKRKKKLIKYSVELNYVNADCSSLFVLRPLYLRRVD